MRNKLILAGICMIGALACGGDATGPDTTRHFLLYTWERNGSTYIVGDRVVLAGNFVEIDSATIDLTAAGAAIETIWYKYAAPSTAPIVSATESFTGRWATVAGNQEIHLPLAGDPDALVGYLGEGQTLPLFRAWQRGGADFGGNFLYLLRI